MKRMLRIVGSIVIASMMLLQSVSAAEIEETEAGDFLECELTDIYEDIDCEIAETTLVDYGYCGADVKWGLFDNGILLIIGSGEMDSYNYLQKSPFYNNNEINYVFIESGVTTVGSCMFRECKNLITVELSEGLTSIGDDAFENCTSLESVELPASLTEIGSSAFEDCTSLTEIDIPGSVSEIKMSAFAGCTGLKNVNIHEGVEDINGSAFEDCVSLESIELPEGLTSIRSMFSGCTNLKTIKLPDTVTSISSSAFKDLSALKTINIPQNVTEIDESTFEGCTSLESIELPEGVESIGISAFENCSSLKSINLPASLTEIEMSAFEDCSSLTRIDIPGTVYKIGQESFYGCSGLTKVNINEGVEYIDFFAFAYCSSLTCVDMPESVRWIEGAAFADCDNLKSIILERGTEPNIDFEAFLGCHNLSICRHKNSTGYYPTIRTSYSSGPKVPYVIMGEKFTDVPEYSYYEVPVYWAYMNGITTGTSDNTFAPGKNCTRAEFVTFLWRAAGSPEPAISYNPFTDIKSRDYYYKAVLWAYENGITTGTSSTTFSPSEACLRNQIVTFIWRYMGKPAAETGNNPFIDVNKESFYCTAVIWAVENGVTTGTSVNTFSPEAACTRGQVATFLYRADKV